MLQLLNSSLPSTRNDRNIFLSCSQFNKHILIDKLVLYAEDMNFLNLYRSPANSENKIVVTTQM